MRELILIIFIFFHLHHIGHYILQTDKSLFSQDFSKKDFSVFLAQAAHKERNRNSHKIFSLIFKSLLYEKY